MLQGNVEHISSSNTLKMLIPVVYLDFVFRVGEAVEVFWHLALCEINCIFEGVHGPRDR
jgi:hypothetical protein